MTTIRHTEPCGLRSEMRLAERGSKSVVFIATEGRMVFATRSEGGVWQDSNSRCGEAAFRYMPHSAVVSHFETARTLRTREKGGDVSDPPQKRGGM